MVVVHRGFSSVIQQRKQLRTTKDEDDDEDVDIDASGPSR